MRMRLVLLQRNMSMAKHTRLELGHIELIKLEQHIKQLEHIEPIELVLEHIELEQALVLVMGVVTIISKNKKYSNYLSLYSFIFNTWYSFLNWNIFCLCLINSPRNIFCLIFHWIVVSDVLRFRYLDLDCLCLIFNNGSLIFDILDS